MTLGAACARVARESPLVPFSGEGGGGYGVVGEGASLLVLLPGIVGSAAASVGLGYGLAATHRTCLVHYPTVPSLDALLTALDAMCAREGGGRSGRWWRRPGRADAGGIVVTDFLRER